MLFANDLFMIRRVKCTREQQKQLNQRMLDVESNRTTECLRVNVQPAMNSAPELVYLSSPSSSISPASSSDVSSSSTSDICILRPNKPSSRRRTIRDLTGVVENNVSCQKSHVKIQPKQPSTASMRLPIRPLSSQDNAKPNSTAQIIQTQQTQGVVNKNQPEFKHMKINKLISEIRYIYIYIYIKMGLT
jgi:hypothetical protein